MDANLNRPTFCGRWGRVFLARRLFLPPSRPLSITETQFQGEEGGRRPVPGSLLRTTQSPEADPEPPARGPRGPPPAVPPSACGSRRLSSARARRRVAGAPAWWAAGSRARLFPRPRSRSGPVHSPRPPLPSDHEAGPEHLSAAESSGPSGPAGGPCGRVSAPIPAPAPAPAPQKTRQQRRPRARAAGEKCPRHSPQVPGRAGVHMDLSGTRTAFFL